MQNGYHVTGSCEDALRGCREQLNRCKQEYYDQITKCENNLKEFQERYFECSNELYQLRSIKSDALYQAEVLSSAIEDGAPPVILKARMAQLLKTLQSSPVSSSDQATARTYDKQTQPPYGYSTSATYHRQAQSSYRPSNNPSCNCATNKNRFDRFSR